MSLKNYLRDQAYDLIDGPVRNHQPFQLWLKKPADEIELYYAHVDQAFTSSAPLSEVVNDALNVNSTKKDSYGFNIGITLLEQILQSLGMGTFELSAKIKSGKNVTISYDNAITKECPVGEIENFFSEADFKHSNPTLLKNANRNHIIIITGVVFAKNLVVEIETDFSLSAELVASLNSVADGKLDFSMNNASSLKMVSSGNGYFPIAVKASKIDYDRGHFKKLKLITDNRNFF